MIRTTSWPQLSPPKTLSTNSGATTNIHFYFGSVSDSQLQGNSSSAILPYDLRQNAATKLVSKKIKDDILNRMKYIKTILGGKYKKIDLDSYLINILSSHGAEKLAELKQEISNLNLILKEVDKLTDELILNNQLSEEFLNGIENKINNYQKNLHKLQISLETRIVDDYAKESINCKIQKRLDQLNSISDYFLRIVIITLFFHDDIDNIRLYLSAIIFSIISLQFLLTVVTFQDNFIISKRKEINDCFELFIKHFSRLHKDLKLINTNLRGSSVEEV